MSAGDHLSGPQFHGARMQIDDTFAKDPTVKTLRRKQPYHDVDEQVGMVH